MNPFKVFGVLMAGFVAVSIVIIAPMVLVLNWFDGLGIAEPLQTVAGVGLGFTYVAIILAIVAWVADKVT